MPLERPADESDVLKLNESEQGKHLLESPSPTLRLERLSSISPDKSFAFARTFGIPQEATEATKFYRQALEVLLVVA